MAEDPENDERQGDAPDSGDPSEGGEDQPAGGNAPADEVEQTPDDKSSDENVSEARTEGGERNDDEYGAGRSDVDAMGNDKRREVVGKQYGASRKKKLAIYGGVLGFVAVLVIVFMTVVTNYDERSVPLEDTAPWATQTDASREPVRDVDFKENGPTDTIPAEEIVNR